MRAMPEPVALGTAAEALKSGTDVLAHPSDTNMHAETRPRAWMAIPFAGCEETCGAVLLPSCRRAATKPSEPKANARLWPSVTDIRVRRL